MTTTSLAVIRQDFDADKIGLIKRTVAKDATDDELKLFVAICQRTGLDPFAKQIYCIHRGGKMGIQTAIDGYRLIAERTGKYAGQLGPFWCGEDGKWVDIWLSKKAPSAAKVGVIRSDFKEPLWGVALWTAYVQNSPFWKPDGHGPGQIAKCAEALALRKTFPQELSGIRTIEEMEQAGPADSDTTGPNVPVPNSRGKGSWPKHVPSTTPAEDAGSAIDADYRAAMRGDVPVYNEDTDTEPPMARIIDDATVEIVDHVTGEVSKQPRPSRAMMTKLQAMRSELKLDDKTWRAGLMKYYKVNTSTLLSKSQVADMLDRLEGTKAKLDKAKADVAEGVTAVLNKFPGSAVVDNEDEQNRKAAEPTEQEMQNG